MFLKGPLYAFKGLADQIAPIVVNLALIMVMMSGGTLSATVGDEHDPTAVFYKPSEALSAEVRVNSFHTDYFESGEVCIIASEMDDSSSSSHNPLKGQVVASFLCYRFHSRILIFHHTTSKGRRQRGKP